MKEYLKNIVLVVLMLFGAGLYAQRPLSGVVRDTEGQTLPGANIVVTGTLVGTTTDFDGKFTLELPAGREEIEVSYVGYTPRRINVQGRSQVEVVLSVAAQQLQEMVVTALGIKRESKALGYSVQQVDAANLQTTNRISPLTGLAGQVAGLQISESGSGAGGSQKILIRGANSLTGSNDPLFVIDGVPVDNSGGSSGGLFGGFDYGSAINNINFDDIESISVLKGGAASALYGARGQNGVIIITTKSGSRKEGLGVSYQTLFSTQHPLIKPDFQTLYAQGSGGNFGQLNPRSWGPKMSGQTVTNFLDENQTLNPVEKHPYDEFFRYDFNMDHSLSIDKRGETNAIFFSASWNRNNGLIPTNRFDKKSFNLRYESRLSEFLTFDARANYINQSARNRPNLAGSPDNPIYLFNLKPVSVGLDQLDPYRTVAGYPVVWTSRYRRNDDGSLSLNQDPVFASSPLLNNPYWAVYRNTNADRRDRMMGFASLNLDLKKLLDLGFDLRLSTKAGLDFYNDERQRITADKTYYKSEGKATGSFQRLQVMEGNYDFLLSGSKQMDKFFLSISGGGNIMQRSFRGLSASSESGLINEYGPYVIQNFVNPVVSNGLTDIRIHSLYAMLSTDYRRMVFLDLTFRNDWTSVLSPKYWSYQYPSVSLSWLLNETFALPETIDLFKLRASWAGVGSGGNIAGQRYFQYGTTPNQFNGLPYGFFNADRPEPNLRSEYTVSKEAGVQLAMWKNRLSADLAVYQTGTRNQIFNNPLPPSSGFNSGFINSGFVNNTGIELAANYKIIYKPLMRWGAGFNFTRQWSKVQELSDQIDLITQGGVAGMRVVARLGEPAGVMLGTAFERDAQGRIVLDSENLPRLKTAPSGAILDDNVIGNATPKYLMGLNSQFEYKRWFASLQFDSKLGHQLFSVTNMVGAEYGTLGFTTEGRDEWYRAVKLAQDAGDPNIRPEDFNLGFRVTGVKNGVEGTFAVDPQKYWDRVSRIHEAFVYDASYIRFRSVNLGYNFGSQQLKNTPFSELAISAFANNIAYLMRKTKNISPESTFGTGNNPGYEIYAYPEMRNMGLSLKLSF
ncbi:MAG: SusC/RagA family TonB-linked outer membrane protein [Bacteroidetes bacterium]|nr:SusC/RagA family TonB-linked outer membrane protein [Bacteroidota bacterium]